MSIYAKVEIVTPKAAHEWLSKMIFNRPLKDTLVDGYARIMRAGGWDLNGQGLIFDDNDLLLDGQHRLHAVIAADCPIEMLVVRGVKKGVFDSIDIGSKRRSADVLGILGFEHTAAFAATLCWVRRYELGNLRSIQPEDKPTSPEIAGMAKRYADVHDSVRWCFSALGKTADRPVIARAHMAFAHWAFHRASGRKATEFFTGLATGADLPVSSVVWQMRKRLLVDVRSRERMSPTVILAMVVKAWNAYCTGEVKKQIVWKETEEFPTIHGFPLPAATKRKDGPA